MPNKALFPFPISNKISRDNFKSARHRSLTHSLTRPRRNPLRCDYEKRPQGSKRRISAVPIRSQEPPHDLPILSIPPQTQTRAEEHCMARIGDTWTPKPSTVHLRIMHMLSPRLDLILLPACLPLLRDKPPGPHGWPLTPSLARSHTHRNRMHHLRLLPTSLSLSPKFDSFLRKLFFWDKRTSLTLLKNVL